MLLTNEMREYVEQELAIARARRAREGGGGLTTNAFTPAPPPIPTPKPFDFSGRRLSEADFLAVNGGATFDPRLDQLAVQLAAARGEAPRAIGRPVIDFKSDPLVNSSHDEIRSAVQDALDKKHGKYSAQVEAMYDDAAIVRTASSKLWRQPYKIENGAGTFVGDPEEVRRRTSYTNASGTVVANQPSSTGTGAPPPIGLPVLNFARCPEPDQPVMTTASSGSLPDEAPVAKARGKAIYNEAGAPPPIGLPTIDFTK